MKQRKIMTGVALVLALAWALRGLLPNEQVRLMKTWNALIEQSSSGGSKALLAGARKALDLQSYFSTGAVIEVGAPHPMTISRAELPGILNQAWQLTESLRVQSRGEDVQMASNRRSAVMETTLELTAVVRGETMSSMEAYRIHWRKDDGEWKISSVQRMETIRNPAAAQ
jgi:hypothetical protein